MLEIILGIAIGALAVFFLKKKESPPKITYKPLPDLPDDTPEAPVRPKKKRINAEENALRVDAEREKKGIGQSV